MKKILVTTIVLLSFTSCFLVHVCIENDKSFKKCLKYPQYTPVTVAEFADILRADSLHYKLVFYGGVCCGGSTWTTYNIYKPLMQRVDTSKLHMYYLINSTAGLKYFPEYQKRMNFYPEKIYYLRDTIYANLKNREWNPNRTKDIISTLYPNGHMATNKKVEFIPQTFISNKQNQVKMVYRINHNSNSPDSVDIEGVQPMNIYHLLVTGQSPESLDYNTIDTLHYTDEYHQYYYYMKEYWAEVDRQDSVRRANMQNETLEQ